MIYPIVSRKMIDDNLKICEDIKSTNENYYNEHWKKLHETLLQVKGEVFGEEPKPGERDNRPPNVMVAPQNMIEYCECKKPQIGPGGPHAWCEKCDKLVK